MAERFESRLPRTVRRHELKLLVPLADTTIYDMEQRGEFPKRFALTSRCVVWDLSEVEAWLAARKATPIARTRHPDVRLRQSRPVRAQDPKPPAE
jgi:prophage regulatory protein